MITGKAYNVLKWLAQIILPGVGALYFTLTGVLGLPATEEVLGTILIVDTVLGVLLGFSQVNYGKRIGGGIVTVTDTSDKLTYNLVLDDDPADLVHMEEVRFKVKLPT